MARVEFVRPDDIEFRQLTELVRERGEPTRIPQNEQDGTYRRTYFDGGPETPELFEIRLDPNLTIRSHAHLYDEIVYVVEGSLRFGRQEYCAGSAVMVPAKTLYGFTA